MFYSKYNNTKNLTVFSLCFSVILFSLSCSSSSSSQTADIGDPPQPVQKIDEDIFMDDTFRIDIKTINVKYDIYPDNLSVTGHATVTFVMRDNQVRPLIHFDPWANSRTVDSAVLNGETLDVANVEDVQIISFQTTNQRAIEFQRDLSSNETHTLEITFTLSNIIQHEGFFTNVHDVNGVGNEEIFPTLNTPQELAHHTITFTVHSEKPYRCIGSGLVTKDLSQTHDTWILDTEREISSYTLMFLLYPEDITTYEERVINNVDVRIMAYNGNPYIQDAFTLLESWLPELETNLGPLPMPRGLSIFLTFQGGGMEYYGGTITSLGALDHEIFHMYFACSTVAKTYRDSWWDEAITMWYLLSAEYSDYPPISDGFSSGIVSNRTPISVGLDTRAYDEGARIFEAVARELGGRGEMIGFLKYVHENHSFAPFNTFDLLDYLNDYAGIDMEDKFLNWLYFGENTYYKMSETASPYEWLHQVDMSPVRKVMSDE